MAKYEKGQSGNRAGRKRGSQNKTTQLAKLLVPYADDLVTKAVELALSGDVQALKLCIDRLIPKATSQNYQLNFGLPSTEQALSLSTIGDGIIKLMFNGDMPPEDAQKLIAILDGQRKLVEHSDLARKVAELEEMYKTT